MVSIFAAGTLLAGAAWAYRPFTGTDAEVVEPGEIEIELGPLGFLHTTEGDYLAAPELVLNLGLAERWELVVEGAHLRALDGNADEARSRVVDTGAFLKGLLRRGSLQGARGPSVAVELGLLLPTVNDEGGYGGEVLLIASRRWAWGTLHTTAGVASSRAGEWEAAGSVIVEGPESFRVRPVAELVGERVNGGSATAGGLVGMIWEARDGLAVDAGIRLGDHEWELRAGLSWAIRKGKEQ